MSGYDEAVERAREAQRDVYRLDLERAAAFDARDHALAKAWVQRPGGVTWRLLVETVCHGLPAAARFTTHTARAAVRSASGTVSR